MARKKVAPDTVCLQCGESYSAVKQNKLFCATVDYFGECDMEWNRHRWRPLSDREEWEEAEAERRIMEYAKSGAWRD